MGLERVKRGRILMIGTRKRGAKETKKTYNYKSDFVYSASQKQK